MANPTNPTASSPANNESPSVVPPKTDAGKFTHEQIEFVLANLGLGPVMVAEYRGEGQEVINYTNKKTGAKESFTKHALALEFGPESAVEQMSCDIDYPKDVVPTPTGYAKGQKLLLVMSGMLRTRDSISGSVKKHRPF
jgi:hypothetical protein